MTHDAFRNEKLIIALEIFAEKMSHTQTGYMNWLTSEI